MKIVADDNMPLVEEFFDGWGEVCRVPGREMTAEVVADAALLLVRSVTQVDQALLGNSPVQFVGTATIGTDHIDQSWLASRHIGFSAAPGCNAEGVVQYVLSVLDVISEQRQRNVRDFQIGIVGAGNVGGRLYRCLSRLGVECLVCDPYLNDADLPLCTLDELIERCDVVTLHTPLIQGGDHPTWHLMDKQRLQSLRLNCLLVNSSRGPVIDNAALYEVLQERADLSVALDVWEHEPEVDLRLLNDIHIATPHIAGYSLEGRLRGTAMIYQAACHYFNRPLTVSLADLMPTPMVQELRLGGEANEADLGRITSRLLYDVRRDDMLMRHTLTGCPDVASAFDRLRKQYPERRENSSLRVIPAPGTRLSSQALVARGFITE